MSNIMINQVCNLRCKYCFADETVNQEVHADNMTFENFKKALQISIRDSRDRIGIIGGEPTIHPEFLRFVKYAAEEYPNNPIVLFSNGIELKKFWKIFLYKNVNCLWNFNGPEISGKQWERIKDSADYIFNELNLQSHFTLGLNLYDINMDYKFFVDACREYNIKTARLAITVPNSKSDRSDGYLERIKQMKDLLIEVCEALASVGTRPHLDCTPIPPCVVTPEDRERIDAFHKKLDMNYKESKFFDNSPCNPVLDIMPDLSVARCFGCSDMGTLKYAKNMTALKSNEYYNMPDAAQIFRHTIDDLGYVVPGNSECVTCQYRLRGECRGGCLGYKKYIIQDAYNMLTANYGGISPYVEQNSDSFGKTYSQM